MLECAKSSQRAVLPTRFSSPPPPQREGEARRRILTLPFQSPRCPSPYRDPIFWSVHSCSVLWARGGVPRVVRRGRSCGRCRVCLAPSAKRTRLSPASPEKPVGPSYLVIGVHVRAAAIAMVPPAVLELVCVGNATPRTRCKSCFRHEGQDWTEREVTRCMPWRQQQVQDKISERLFWQLT